MFDAVWKLTIINLPLPRKTQACLQLKLLLPPFPRFILREFSIHLKFFYFFLYTSFNKVTHNLPLFVFHSVNQISHYLNLKILGSLLCMTFPLKRQAMLKNFPQSIKQASNAIRCGKFLLKKVNHKISLKSCNSLLFSLIRNHNHSSSDSSLQFFKTLIMSTYFFFL